MITIAISGCAGRMGKALLKETAAQKGAKLVGGSALKKDAPLVQQNLAELGISPTLFTLVHTPKELVAMADVVIDFTTPDYSLLIAQEAAKQKKAMVIGTTGFSPAQKKQLTAFSKKTPILMSGNMSLGVHLLARLVEQTARALDVAYDIEIVEMHHNRKVDAPSGTAILLGEAAARGRGVKLENVADRGRDGITGARKAGDIGFVSLRGGDVIGDHTVMFAGPAERIELTHKATDRALFAKGALKAALFLAGQKPGLYGMKEVIG